MGKPNTHSPIYWTKDNWENWLHLRHTLEIDINQSATSNRTTHLMIALTREAPNSLIQLLLLISMIVVHSLSFTMRQEYWMFRPSSGLLQKMWHPRDRRQLEWSPCTFLHKLDTIIEPLHWFMPRSEKLSNVHGNPSNNMKEDQSLRESIWHSACIDLYVVQPVVTEAPV